MTISTLFTLTLSLSRRARESRIKIFLLMIYDHIYAIYPHCPLSRGARESRIKIFLLMIYDHIYAIIPYLDPLPQGE